MGEIARFRRPDRIAAPDAAEITRRIDSMAAQFPAIEPSLEVVRHDLFRLRETPTAWSFIMLGPTENAIVLEAIVSEARRLKVSALLWSAMLCRIAPDTGEIKMTRKEMMDAANTKHSGHITVALSEFHKWGALIKDRRGTATHWFFNPRIATNLAKHARPWHQKDAPDVVQLAAERKRLRQADPNSGPIHAPGQTDIEDFGA